MVASVGMPPSISRAGAGACTTPSSQGRQAYFGRRVTSTRNCAGTMSSRSLLSSPIRCNSPWQQRAGLVVDVDDDLNPRQMRRQRAAVGPALASPALSLGRATDLALAASLAAACSTSSRPSSIWSSGSVSALRPKRCRCSSLMIWRSRSFCTRSASSIAFSVSGSSGNASLGITKSDHIRPTLCDDPRCA